MITMYNPNTAVIIQTTEEFRNQWLSLGFIDLTTSKVQVYVA